jgi:hypothetical protein
VRPLPRLGQPSACTVYFRDLVAAGSGCDCKQIENIAVARCSCSGRMGCEFSKIKRMESMRKVCCLALLLMFVATAESFAANLSATTATFASVFNSVQAGDVILCAPGNYGRFSGASKSGMVTIQPDPTAGGTQANVVFGSLSFSSSVQNMTLSGVTVAGGDISATHIHLNNIHYTSSMCLHQPGNVDMDLILDGGDFTNVGQSCTEGRLGITGNNINHSVVNGIVIKNIKFSGPGPSDGIQINGGAYGTVIGPGNEFVGIKESGCGSVHCDPIQFYGAVNTTVTGNYFHGNSTGIMSSSSNGTPVTVTNNVFVTDGEYPDQIVQEGGHNDVINHNTFANGARIRFCNCNGTGLSSNETVTNNILTGGISLTEGQTTGTFTIDYNMIPGGGTGSHTINGSPSYVGGSLPSTYAGFKLASGSLGTNSASDGNDIGIGVGGQAPPSGLSAIAH